MQVLMFLILVGLCGGVAVGIQAPLASLVGQRLNTLESVFIVHLGGAIAAGIPLIALRGGKLAEWRRVPWYALGAGALGLVVIGSISYTLPRLGTTSTIILIVVGQLIIGMLIDHFGWLGTPVRPLDLSRLLGIAVLFAGVWLIVH